MPVSVDKSLRQAKALAKKGMREEARRLCEAVLAEYPANRRARAELDALAGPPTAKADAPLDRGEAEAVLRLYRRGRLQDALAATMHMAAAHPREPFPENLLGAIRNELGETERAVSHYAAAIALKPDDPEARNNLGDALNTLGRHDEAEHSLRKALSLRPRFAEAHNNLGLAHLYRGEQPEAVRRFRRALELKPGYAECFRNLSTARTFEPGDPLVDRMETLLEQERSDEGRMQLSFALAKAHDDIDAPDRAYPLLEEGNRIRRRQLGYDPAEDRALFAEIKAAFATPPPAIATDEHPGDRHRPIFVVGMPRSGTTLVETILASHSRVHGAGELDVLRKSVRPLVRRRLDGDRSPVGDDELRRIRESYHAGLESLGVSEPVIVDKMPGNFRWIGFIAAALPEARIVCLERDRMAVRWSIFRHFFPARGLGFAWDIADIDAYQDLHDDLVAYWQSAWPRRIHALSYEALTEDPEAETRRLLDGCGLDWEEACLDFHRTPRSIRTASALQARKPIYRGSSQDWRRYAAFLPPLRAAA